MKYVLLLFLSLTMFHFGLRKGYSKGTKEVRKAFIAGCSKGGESPALTPWPLCPRAADDYISDKEKI